MSNTGTINISLKIDDKGSVRVLQNVGKESSSTGAKGKKAFSDMDKSATSFNESAKMTGSTLLKMGAAVVGIIGLAKAWGTLTSAGREYIALAGEQEDAERKLGSVLRATGEAAGFTFAQLKAMAAGLQDVTRYGDETTMAGMAILATFKQVRGEAFERATVAAMDMSEIMGQDLNSSIVQVGKALNDPIVGLTALSRVGVTFSQGQKDTIKTLQESGDMIGAQNVILKELESQFGGTAKAAVNDFKGGVIQAKNALGDAKEEMGFVITKNQVFIEMTHLATEEFKRWGEQIKANRDDLMLMSKEGILTVVKSLKVAIETMRFFHNGWQGIKLAGNLAVQALALSLDELYPYLRTLLVPLDAVYQGMVKLGLMDVNPFDAIGEGLDTFRDSSAQVTKAVLDDIEKTNNRYDAISDTLGRYIHEIETIPAAVDKAAESQKNAHGNRLGQIEKETEAAAKQAKTEEEFLAAHQKATMTQVEYDLAVLDEQYDRYGKHVRDKLKLEEWYSAELKKLKDKRNKAIEDALDGYFADIEKAEDDYRKKQAKSAEDSLRTQTEVLKKQQDAHKDFSDTVQDYTADIINDWENAWDTMLNIVQRTLSEMAAELMAQKLIVPIAMEVGSSLGLSWKGTSFADMASGSRLLGNLSGGTGTGFNIPGLGYISKLFGSTSGLSAASVAGGAPAGFTGVAVGEAFGGSAAATGFSMASLAPIAAVAIPIITKLLEKDLDPYIGFQSYAPHDKSDRPGGPATFSEQFNFWAWSQDFEGAELRSAIVAYFEDKFTAIDNLVSGSLKDVLASSNFATGWIPAGQWQGNADGLIRHMENLILADIIDPMMDRILAGLDTAVFNGVALPGPTFGTRVIGTQSRDDFDMGIGPRTETYEIPATIQSHAHQFLLDIARDGESALDTFARFAVTMENTEDATSAFNRQIELLNGDVVAAYNNLEYLVGALQQVDAAAEELSRIAAIDTFDAFVAGWDDLIDAMTDAAAQVEQLTRAETIRNQSIGAQISGLTGSSVYGMISSGRSVTDALMENLWSAFVSGMAPDLMDQYISPLNQAIGEVFGETGDLMTAIEAIPGIMDRLDFDQLGTTLADARTEFDALMGIIAETTEGVEKVIDQEQLLADQRSLQMRVLGALGEDEAVIALQRENELTKIAAAYGDAAGPLMDLVTQIYHIEAAARDAAAASEATAQALNRMETAGYAYLSALRSEMAGLEKDFDTAKATYLQALNDELKHHEDALDILETDLGTARTDYMSSLKAEQFEMEQLAGTLKNVINSTVEYRRSLRVESAGGAGRQEALMLEQTRLKSQVLAGDFDALPDLISISGQYLAAAKAASRTEADYLSEVKRTDTLMAAVETKAKDQLTDTEKQIQQLTDLNAGVQDTTGQVRDYKTAWQDYVSAKEAFDASAHRSRIETLQTIIADVEGTTRQIRDMDLARQMYEDAKMALDNTWYIDQISLLADLLGETKTLVALQAEYKAASNAYENLPGFAGGGIASGPESGYPVMLHGMEVITPVNDFKALTTEIRELKREIVTLRTENSAQNISLIKSSQKVERYTGYLEEWAAAGLPAEAV